VSAIDWLRILLKAWPLGFTEIRLRSRFMPNRRLTRQRLRTRVRSYLNTPGGVRQLALAYRLDFYSLPLRSPLFPSNSTLPIAPEARGLASPLVIVAQIRNEKLLFDVILLKEIKILPFVASSL
jgi:hypothetical protein